MVKLDEPDKGRAWMIAIAASIINMILSGLSRMIGILYVAVISTYGISRQDATLPFTVRNAIRCLSGPVVGVIGERYGIRTVTFFGGVVASAGAALCCIAPNATWLAVFWGGVHGFGFAFANTLFQVVVNQYFQKYRATASGIALSGACIGSLGFPIMIEEILLAFGLSGGFLILGGVVMHVLPFSLLLSEAPWVENPERYYRLLALQKSKESATEAQGVSNADYTRASSTEDDDDMIKIRSTSLSNCPIEQFDVCSSSRRSLRKKGINNMISQFEKLVPAKRNSVCDRKVVCTLFKITESPQVDRKADFENGHIITDEASPTQGVYSVSEVVSSNENKESGKENLPFPEAGEMPPHRKPDSLLKIIKGIALLYTSPVYVLISLCMATYVIIFIPILTVTIDYSKDKGIAESSGKYLINAMAIGDLVGRLCFGWVTDKGFLSIPAFMILTLVLEGAFIALFPFANSLYSFMILLALYGMTAGSILVLFPILVLNYVDEKQQSVAMGCVGFFSGLVSLGIPFLIGHYRDYVGSYDGMFYLTGIISVVSGSLWLLEPLMAKWHYKLNKKKADIVSSVSHPS